jgi:hypothetical protein
LKPAATSPLQRDEAPPRPLGRIVRIELSNECRRHLAKMAREAGISADELASRMLSDLIDDDAKAHEPPKVAEP